jgi:hypothetical protein
VHQCRRIERFTGPQARRLLARAHPKLAVHEVEETIPRDGIAATHRRQQTVISSSAVTR